MIAAAIVCTATFTQAASLDLAAYGALDTRGAGAGEVDDDWYTGGQAYLIMVTDTGTISVADDLTITGGSIVHQAGVEGGLAMAGIDGSKIGEGIVDGSAYNFAVLFTTEGTEEKLPTTGLYGVNDNDVSFYEVTWNKDMGGSFGTDETWASVTSTVGGQPDPGPDPIPEPTSGLLLLLGVAGLALRRRA